VGLLDGKRLNLAKVTPGDSVYLELESFDSHQLESERLLPHHPSTTHYITVVSG
jgi:hypothetical protein